MLMLVSRYSIALYRGCSEKRPWENFYILTTYMCIVMQLFSFSRETFSPHPIDEGDVLLHVTQWSVRVMTYRI